MSLITNIRDSFIYFLPKSIVKFIAKGGDFVFLVHPLEFKDASRKFTFAKYLPYPVINIWTRVFWPVLGPPITGFRTRSGREIKGWTIFCPLTPRQMLKNPELARRKIREAIELSEKIGVKLVGLGAFTSILTHDGIDLLNKKTIGLTTGNAFSAALILKNLMKLLELLDIDLRQIYVAIIGAAGSVGSACSKILASKVRKLLLIDINYKELDNLHKKLKDKNNVQINNKIEKDEIRFVNVIIAVTSTPGTILTSRDLHPGVIVIDAAQPKNISEIVDSERDDVLVIESGVAKVPGIKYKFNFGTNSDEVFGCLGELLILSWIGWDRHYSLGKVNPHHVEELLDLSEKAGLFLAPFRNSSRLIKEADIIKFRKHKRIQIK